MPETNLDINHTRNRLASQLSRILPPAALLTTEEDLRPYECDGLSAYHRLPLMVVLPESIEQVQAVLQLC